MNVTVKLPSLVVACVASAALGAFIYARYIDFVHKQGPTHRLQRETPEFQRFAVSQGSLSQSGRSAEAAGNSTAAEADYAAEVQADPKNLDRLRLAELEEGAGQHQKALDDMKLLTHPPKGVENSMLMDPRILTEYADLAMQYGSKEDGREFYYKAASQPASIEGEFKLKLDRVSKDDSLKVLRARAYANAGTACSDKPKEAVRLEQLAVSLAPRDVFARIAYSEALRFASMNGVSTSVPTAERPEREEAKAQLWQAEQLASGESKALINKRRRLWFGYYGQATDHIDFNNGKPRSWVTHETPDRPDKPVTTPHPVDPIANAANPAP